MPGDFFIIIFSIKLKWVCCLRPDVDVLEDKSRLANRDADRLGKWIHPCTLTQPLTPGPLTEFDVQADAGEWFPEAEPL
jgi:hypothetical protein